MTAAIKRSAARAGAPLSIAAGALALRLVAGVGFVNYDTLYALAWGGQLSRGQPPAYDVAIAPTPHPLLELLGVVLVPLGPRTARDVTVALGFLALAACGWVLYRLGARWFSRPVGALAALIFLTRVPVLSYGVRAYVDVPYVLLVLAALLVESRRPRAGAPVLALLALAGLLRPEAWAFSGLYWLYAIGWQPAFVRRRRGRKAHAGEGAPDAWDAPNAPTARGTLRPPRRSRREIALLALLAGAAPLVWVLSDLAITGDALWSLSNTRHTASTLGRVKGIANVPEYIPRRIGEILRPPVLLAAALGGVLSWSWLRRRALPGAAAGVLAVVVFALFAAVGLPINTRYAFLASAILCVFAGAGVFGWLNLPRGDRRRRWWIAGAAVALLALLAYAPSQYRTAHGEMDELARQQSIEGDLLALVDDHAINLACGPVGVPNHAPIPLLALFLKTSPRNVVSLQIGHIAAGVYLDPANREVETHYVLDKKDPVAKAVTVPPGFTETSANRSWLIFHRCD
ncbi:MAG TPA: hypothetical protein VG366_03375 [Solirubrobacteraceae bacterium]|jgi:hypothetical protein|nr:hypothetical protein [Solirubrobacteraceae bacterium]